MGNYSIEFVLEIIKGDIECGFKTAHEAIGEVIEAYEIRDRRIAQKIRERVEAREANFASTLCGSSDKSCDFIIMQIEKS